MASALNIDLSKTIKITNPANKRARFPCQNVISVERYLQIADFKGIVT